MLASLTAYAGQGDAETPLPVDDWDPPFCGDIDMRIAYDGAWHYNGTPILRPSLVRLFARLLRRDGQAYVLVTPVEKVGITVEDVPFIAVTMNQEDGTLVFRTGVGDTVAAGPDHPLRFVIDAEGAFVPYVHIRGGLEARLSPSLARDLAALAEVADGHLGIRSGNSFFTIGPANQLFDSAG